MPFNLAPARETELPEVVELMNMAFRGIGPNAGWNSEGEFIDGGPHQSGRPKKRYRGKS